MRSWIIAVALVIALIGAYAVYAYRAGEGMHAAPVQTKPVSYLESVKDTYSGGTHSVSGFITAPDACTKATASGIPTADGIRVDVAAETSNGVCLELPTSTMFATEVDGDAEAIVSVYVDGAFATTTKGVAPPAKPAAKKK